MKRIFLTSVLALLVATPAVAEMVTLKFAGWGPPNVNINLAQQAWARAVEKDSNGTVKIDFYWETLGNARTMYDVVRNGVADFGWILQPLVPGKFPRTSVVELPFLVTSSMQGSVALWRIYEKGLIKTEYDEVKPLGLAVLPPSVLHSKAPMPNAEALAGKKFRIAGRVNAQMMESLKATGVQMAITGVYEGISKGVIDGSLSPWLAFTAFKHDEVAKYHVDIPLGGVAGLVGMNNRTWEKLSPQIKAAIDKNSGLLLSASIGKYNDEDAAVHKQKVMTSPGQTVIKFPPAEIASLEKKFEPITAAWLTATPNGAEILKVFKEELAAADNKK
ncbi:MAG: TRAP transporter substrate-binding protein [Alphaproteobacteria bacterium]